LVVCVDHVAKAVDTNKHLHEEKIGAS
jgi:hypothetical protein